MKPTLIVTSVLLTASPLAAQDSSIDTDADGMYSLAELQAAMPEMTEDQFVILDVNADGMLDADEIAAASEAVFLPAMDG